MKKKLTLDEVVAEARKLIESHEKGAHADAGFDGGEFSGPAHGRAIERGFEELASANGFTAIDVWNEINKQDSAVELTLKQVRTELQALGVMIRRSPATKEYQIKLYAQKWSDAYFTNDLDDALKTGRDMAARQRGTKRLLRRADNYAQGDSMQSASSKALGVEIGEIVVKLSEGNVAEAIVLQSLIDYTDPAYKDAAIQLSSILIRFAHNIEGAETDIERTVRL